MKTTIKTVLVVTLLVGVFWGLGFQREPERGAQIANHDGVPIYYHRGPDVRGEYGLEYECVEFVNRWLVRHRHKNLNRTGDAMAYFTDARTKGLTSYVNGGTEPPKWGDVIVFSSSQQSFGHVGIVVQVDKTRVWVAQQNATIKLGIFVRPMPYRWFPMSNRDGRWTVYNSWPLSCLGWSRPFKPAP